MTLTGLVLQQIDENSQIREELSTIQGENKALLTDLEALNVSIGRFRDENQTLHDRAVGKVLSLERRVVTLDVLEEKISSLTSNIQSEPVVPPEENFLKGEKEWAIVRLEEHPDDGRALMTLGEIFFEEGDLVSSSSYLEELVEQEPFNEEAYTLLARISLKEGDYSKAVYLYNRLTRLKPENPFYFNSLARSYLDSDQVGNAVEAIEASLSLDGESVVSLNLAGEIYWKNQAFTLSQQAFEKSLQLNYDPHIATSLGDLLYLKGESGGALSQWQAALREYDGFSVEEDREIKSLYGKMARLSVETGQYRQVEDFYRSVEERGGDADVFYFYLSSLLSRGKEKLFEEKLRLFEERYPDSPYDEELTAMKSAGGGV
ncbi:tetratricopeptide repeat protein [Spirochaeta isovalerica]|uniref:Tetratricopeptide (TPR) repeat protein n=1 Tax=Spirochaeta isovalerica TaxID=150 RepID=A0A841REY1_9SPIO|nr:tetratricopeptide repeat protein [Spirochaeta isovalerica]MBB6480912.1 tetratricopeptide (TPR) repeat protein [Spirochaeta isovalerica]